MCLRLLEPAGDSRLVGGRLPAGDQTQAILGIACPGMVYPYLRAIVSDVCTRAGFPPVLLSEINFQAMFEAQQQQLAAQGNGGEAPSLN